jgi:hypothetical protein
VSTPSPTGFVLTELLVAGLLAAFLMLGLIQMAAGVSRGLLLIESLSQSQQGGRFAVDQIRDGVMAAGFHPSPWDGSSTIPGLGEETSDGGLDGNDVLVLRQLSDKNCYGNSNTILDGNGRPAFFLRESIFEVTANRNLSHTCRFGPDGGAMVRQINHQGLVQKVESFQLLYAEDSDGDRLANRLVRAGNWNDISNITGIEIGLLIATKESLGEPQTSTMMVLDQAVTPAPDGRLRQVWTTTIPLVSKLR